MIETVFVATAILSFLHSYFTTPLFEKTRYRVERAGIDVLFEIMVPAVIIYSVWLVFPQIVFVYYALVGAYVIMLLNVLLNSIKRRKYY